MGNQIEIRVAAMRRSGYHAIVNWILSQALQTPSNLDRPGQTDIHITFVNDANTDRSPFLEHANYKDFRDGRPRSNTPLLPGDERDWLIYSYEDRALRAIFSDAFEEAHDRFIGPSKRRIDIVTLRDPFNCFASRLIHPWKQGPPHTDAERGYAGAKRLWKNYAREFTNRTNFARHNKLAINYNLWFTDREYRAQLATILGLRFTDEGWKAVTAYGGGSSFDGVRYDGRADQMPVLERWKTVQNDARFRMAFQDEELCALSNEIFGCIEGTESLLQPALSSPSPNAGERYRPVKRGHTVGAGRPNPNRGPA